MDKLLSRYTEAQRNVVSTFFTKLAATTNKTGKMLPGKKEKILRSWEGYHPAIIIEALNIYLKMDIPPSAYGKGKNEKYVLGIIKNKAGEVNVGRGYSSSIYPASGSNPEDEGNRLSKLISKRKPTDKELECDF